MAVIGHNVISVVMAILLLLFQLPTATPKWVEGHLKTTKVSTIIIVTIYFYNGTARLIRSILILGLVKVNQALCKRDLP